MSHFMERIKALVPHLPTQRELDEAYLSEATDIYDVERRLYEIDHRVHDTRHVPLHAYTYPHH